MTNLSVNYLGIPMKTPLISASGTVGFGLEIAEYVDMNKVGAISGRALRRLPGKEMKAYALLKRIPAC